jgi:small subunit ribosomal protein S3
MGQKVNPYGLRLGIVSPWRSVWYSEKNYADNLLEDLKIRNFFRNLSKQDNKDYGVADVHVQRFTRRINVNVFTSRPGMIYGAKGANIDEIKKRLQKHLGIKSDDETRVINVNIKAVKKAELNSTLVAQNIAAQLIKRIPFRRAMKQAINGALQAGCKGIKIRVSGRLAGSDIARVESYKEGRVPLHTLRADIDYGTAESLTTFGQIGVKVWIYNGDVFKSDRKEE